MIFPLSFLVLDKTSSVIKDRLTGGSKQKFKNIYTSCIHETHQGKLSNS